MKLPRHQFKKAWEIRADFLAKKTTSERVTGEYLERLSRDDTNSYITVTSDDALSAARTADKEFAQGKVASRIAGIPIGLKDILLTKGVRTTCGSKVLENYISPYDGTVVAKLKAARSVSLGKLNMDEFAMGSSGEDSAYGKTLLPFARDRVPGGSSSGSAAAVAGNLAVMTIGTDTGGSVRQPASFSGVVGLKPTYGRVSRYGVIAFASSLDQVGPVALDAQDTADFLDAIAGYDEWDATSSSRPADASGLAVEKIRQDKSARAGFLKKLRVGVPQEFFAKGLNSGVQEKVEGAIESLRRAGAEIVPVTLPHSKYSLSVYYVVAVSEASANLARFDGVRFGTRKMPDAERTTLEEMYETTRGELFGKEVKRRILLGTFTLSAGYYDAYYRKACQVRNLISQDFSAAFAKCDLIIGPTTPTVSFPLGGGGKKEDPLTMYLNDIYTVPVNLAGLPAVSLPWGFSEGLPVGVQLIGPAFSETNLLCATAALEILHDEGGIA